MSLQSFSVTRALAELKTLQKRIDRLQNETVFVSTKTVGKSWKDHVNDTKANWQAVNDLMVRYEKIKFALVISNATTKVTISGKTYTVAEAIAKKDHLSQKRELLKKLREQRSFVDQCVKAHEHDVQARLDSLLNASLGSQRKESADTTAISEPFLRNNKIEVVDPINIDKATALLDSEITEFEKEVDLVLSESNAVTQLVL